MLMFQLHEIVLTRHTWAKIVLMVKLGFTKCVFLVQSLVIIPEKNVLYMQA